MTTVAVLGRHKEHDPRSLNYPAQTAAVVTKVWTHYGAVLDQGQVGSCTGNAMAQALNTKPLRAVGRALLREADAVQLYSAATALDNVPGTYPPDDTGSSGLAVAKAAQNAGYITGYTHAFDLDHVLGALMLGPLICGTDWHQDMFNPDPDGTVHPTGAIAGGHEYLLLGVHPRMERLTFLNSWSKSWGYHGRFYMSFDDFDGLLNAGGDAVAPRP
jgi:hypothetical protein